MQRRPQPSAAPCQASRSCGVLVMIASTPASVSRCQSAGSSHVQTATAIPAGAAPARGRDDRAPRGSPGCRPSPPARGSARPDRGRAVRPAGRAAAPVRTTGSPVARTPRTTRMNTRPSCPLAPLTRSTSAICSAVCSPLISSSTRRRPASAVPSSSHSAGTPAPGEPGTARSARSAAVSDTDRSGARRSSGPDRRRAGSPAPRQLSVGCRPPPTRRRSPRPPRRPAVCSPARAPTPPDDAMTTACRPGPAQAEADRPVAKRFHGRCHRRDVAPVAGGSRRPASTPGCCARLLVARRQRPSGR